MSDASVVDSIYINYQDRRSSPEVSWTNCRHLGSTDTWPEAQFLPDFLNKQSFMFCDVYINFQRYFQTMRCFKKLSRTARSAMLRYYPRNWFSFVRLRDHSIQFPSTNNRWDDNPAVGWNKSLQHKQAADVSLISCCNWWIREQLFSTSLVCVCIHLCV